MVGLASQMQDPDELTKFVGDLDGGKGEDSRYRRGEEEEEESRRKRRTSSAAFSRIASNRPPHGARQQPSYDHKGSSSWHPTGRVIRRFCPG